MSNAMLGYANASSTYTMASNKPNKLAFPRYRSDDSSPRSPSAWWHADLCQDVDG